MASGDTMMVWDATAGKPGGASSGTAATDALRNGVPVKAFDDTTDTISIFYGVLPRRYAGGGLTLTLHAFHTSTTGSSRWLCAIERGNTDIDADSFAADQGGSITANGTSGIASSVAIAFTSGAQMDSLAAGEPFRLRVTRDGDGTTGTDDATGAQLWLLELRET
jgi:hypothetical protein